MDEAINTTKRPLFFDKEPHLWYGPCDSFGGKGQWCSECARIIGLLKEICLANVKDGTIEDLNRIISKGWSDICF